MINSINERKIYLQINNYIEEQILGEKIVVGEKLPSANLLAVQLKVNSNTILRSYKALAQQSIIIQRRGIGYFLTDDGLERVKTMRQSHFLNIELPIFFEKMYKLNIVFEQLKRYSAGLHIE